MHLPNVYGGACFHNASAFKTPSAHVMSRAVAYPTEPVPAEIHNL